MKKALLWMMIVRSDWAATKLWRFWGRYHAELVVKKLLHDIINLTGGGSKFFQQADPGEAEINSQEDFYGLS